MNTMRQVGNTTRRGGGVCRLIRMNSTITPQTLPGIQRDLLRELNSYNEVAVDFSDVVAVDTAGIRAILALRQEATRENKSLRFISRSKHFLQLLELMNKSSRENASTC